MGTVLPTPEFLRALRELTQRHGALLIFDEVMTGFRVAYGGAQSLFDINARSDDAGQDRRRRAAGRRLRRPGRDHGPHPAGRARCFRPARSAAIRWPRPRASPRSRCCATSRRTTSWSDSARSSKPGWQRRRSGGRGAQRHPRRQHADAVLQRRAGDRLGRGQPVATRRRYGRYFWGLIERGVYMPCSQYEALFVSAAHSEADIAATVAAAKEALS